MIMVTCYIKNNGTHINLFFTRFVFPYFFLSLRFQVFVDESEENCCCSGSFFFVCFPATFNFRCDYLRLTLELKLIWETRRKLDRKKCVQIRNHFYSYLWTNLFFQHKENELMKITKKKFLNLLGLIFTQTIRL